jgi:hypothetical protein
MTNHERATLRKGFRAIHVEGKRDILVAFLRGAISGAILLTVALSIFQDVLGLDRYLEWSRDAWVDPWSPSTWIVYAMLGASLCMQWHWTQNDRAIYQAAIDDIDVMNARKAEDTTQPQ